MKNIALMLIILLSTPCLSAEFECEDQLSGSTLKLDLSIDRAFNRSVVFKLCNKENVPILFAITEGSDFEPLNVNLNADEYEEIIEIIEKVAADARKPVNRGIYIDGSQWCLSHFEPFEAESYCVPSPKDRSNERNTGQLLRLGTVVWKLVNGDKRYGDLY